MFEQNALFRSDGLGNFRDLVQAMSIQPAMLIYLDNETNVAGAEQENFAREVMELHTIGNARFSEEDVNVEAKVIGVVKDFHLEPTLYEIAPMVLTLRSPSEMPMPGRSRIRSSTRSWRRNTHTSAPTSR